MERSYKAMVKYTLYVLLFIFLFVVAVIVCSPYGSREGFSYKLIQYSVDINAPAEKIFTYLGNSKNAAKWSSFVNHITVLNPTDFKDGTPGSRRRCFHHSNEKGMQWDELITETTPNKKRALSIYNLINFPFTAQNLATEQRYQSIGNNKCRLTLTLFFKSANPSVWDTFKMHIAAYKINIIFERNLLKIKQINEGHINE